MREAFERDAETRGHDAREELAELLRTNEEREMERFWETVSTNLAAKRLRLLFVADDIPDPLARTVAFLNAQMPEIEVLAVEIKRFPGKSGQTLVPRVIGRTSAGSSRGRSGRAQTRASFLEGFSNDDVRAVAERLLDVARQSNGEIFYGTQGISIRARSPAWGRPISIAWFYSQPDQGWMRTREFSFGSAVFDYELPDALQVMLERWVGEFASDSFTEDVSSKGVKAWTVHARHRGSAPGSSRGAAAGRPLEPGVSLMDNGCGVAAIAHPRLPWEHSWPTDPLRVRHDRDHCPTALSTAA